MIPPPNPAAPFHDPAIKFLTQTELVAGTTMARIVEVEGYCYSATHPDPFAHRHPVQERTGFWYFHRVRTGYRGGSYKGLDLTLGQPGVFAGLLIRSLRLSDGHRVDGPSRVVDFLLQATGFASPAALDAKLQDRRIDDPTAVMRVQPAGPPNLELLTCPRVGLSLKTYTGPSFEIAFEFLFRPYRYVGDASQTRTGRPHLATALLLAGEAPESVAARTSIPHRVVERYRADLARGAARPPLDFAGRVLGASDWVQAYGAWAARRGNRESGRNVDHGAASDR